MMKVLIIDNYDSFTYNLAHYLIELGATVSVIRNDKVLTKRCEEFDKIVLSPGPGIPDEAGELKSIIRKYYKLKPILGVCLGFQAIIEVFGGQIENLKNVFHGVSSTIRIIDSEDVLYKNFKSKIKAGRYHSWAAKNPLPNCLKITSIDENNTIMSFTHRDFPIYGVQYHPESVLTKKGKKLLKNWLFN